MRKKLRGAQIAVAGAAAEPVSYWFWLLLGLLLIVYVVGFYYDVRLRDSFSWMDPGQYYQFAGSLAGAFHDNGQFNVPSIFPLFIVPFLRVCGVSIVSALWVNIFFLVILCLAVRRLCRQFEITVSPLLVTIAILSSPLLIGLSRELYIEFALTAVNALVFSLWFDSRREAGHWRTVLFGAAFGLGLMMKTTFPMFFIGPFVVVAVSMVKARQYAKLVWETAAFVVPVIVVVALTYLLFKQSFVYYLTLGNSTIPASKLFGPGPVSSVPSLVYYASQIWKTLLFLLTPFLILALLWRRSRSALVDRKAMVLWAWLAGPMLILTFLELKMPRYVAPCVVPAVLLLFRGISAIQAARARNAISTFVLAVSMTQYLLVTNHAVKAPYYLDQASLSTGILEVMKDSDPSFKQYTGDDASFREYSWLRTKNVLLRDFEPNMAVSLAWNLRPAVVFDYNLLQESRQRFNDIAHHRFEDLFYYTACSLYNRRCLCRNYYDTLNLQTVLDNADYILVCLGRKESNGNETPGFRSAAIIGKGASRIQILVASNPSAPSYRAIYARELLRSRDSLPAPDLAAIYFDLAIDAWLHRDAKELIRLFSEYPLERLLVDDFPPDMKNIYWMADDIQFKKTMRAYLNSSLAKLKEQGHLPK